MYVRGFPEWTRSDELLAHCDPRGDLTKDVIMKEWFAFIVYKRPEDAARACRELNRSMFNGRRLTIEPSSK